MEKKRKFYISKNTTFWATVATFICFIAYMVVLICISWISQSATASVPYGFYVARDIFLVVFTILLTTLLTGFFVEVRTKNDLYANAILQDVLVNPFFYKEFSDETKKLMLNELERELLFSNNADVQNMYESIQQKLSSVENTGYYYEECDYHVSCSISKGVITKRINRTIRLRSYEKKLTIRNLMVLNWSGLESIADHFSLEQIVYNGQEISDYTVENIKSTNDTDSFCGYTVSHLCKVTRDVELYSDKNTTISVVYTTKVPISDNLYTCRTSVPCRRFSVSVNLENSPEYKLNAVAFGFLDAAGASPAGINDHEVRIQFEDWVFNKDGVTIAFAPKGQTLPAFSNHAATRRQDFSWVSG